MEERDVMKAGSKILSLFLSIAVIVSMIPVMSFADDEEAGSYWVKCTGTEDIISGETYLISHDGLYLDSEASSRAVSGSMEEEFIADGKAYYADSFADSSKWIIDRTKSGSAVKNCRNGKYLDLLNPGLFTNEKRRNIISYENESFHIYRIVTRLGCYDGVFVSGDALTTRAASLDMYRLVKKERPSYAVSFRLQDSEGKPVTGAEFTLSYSNGLSPLKAVSGEDGSVSFEGVYSDYAFEVEESAAPAGYEQASSMNGEVSYSGLVINGQPVENEYIVTVKKIQSMENPMLDVGAQPLHHTGSLVEAPGKISSVSLSSTKTTITVNWNTVPKADGYAIFFKRSGDKYYNPIPFFVGSSSKSYKISKLDSDSKSMCIQKEWTGSEVWRLSDKEHFNKERRAFKGYNFIIKGRKEKSNNKVEEGFRCRRISDQVQEDFIKVMEEHNCFIQDTVKDSYKSYKA